MVCFQTHLQAIYRCLQIWRSTLKLDNQLLRQSLQDLQIICINYIQRCIPETQTDPSIKTQIFHLGHISHFNYYLVKCLETYQLVMDAAHLEQLGYLRYQPILDICIIEPGEFGYFSEQ